MRVVLAAARVVCSLEQPRLLFQQGKLTLLRLVAVVLVVQAEAGPATLALMALTHNLVHLLRQLAVVAVGLLLRRVQRVVPVVVPPVAIQV